MKYKIKVDTIWEFGQRKDAEGNPHQEDSLYPAHKAAQASDRLFILCDGMGGHDAGEVASATVCETMSQSILRSCPDPEGDFDDGRFEEALADAFAALDDTATAQGESVASIKKMGTTMTFLKLHQDGATIAHLGDSRVYHIRPEGDTARVVWHTEDHSLVNDLVRIGEITPEEALTHPRKNVITRAMQPFNERPPRADIHHITDIMPGDFFYLCSDGMLEQMNDQQLCYYFSHEVDDKERAHKLAIATQDNKDNHTAIIVKIEAVTEAPVHKPDMTRVELVGTVEEADDASDKALPMQTREHREMLPPKRGKGVLLLSALVLLLLAWGGYMFFSHDAEEEGSDKTEEPIQQHPEQTDVNSSIGHRTTPMQQSPSQSQ